jgi:hypothetical protein
VIAHPSALRRNPAFILVILGLIGVGTIVIHEWRLGSGVGEGETWKRLRLRWMRVRRGRT